MNLLNIYWVINFSWRLYNNKSDNLVNEYVIIVFYLGTSHMSKLIIFDLYFFLSRLHHHYIYIYIYMYIYIAFI